jgi:hypothetical protein
MAWQEHRQGQAGDGRGNEILPWPIEPNGTRKLRVVIESWEQTLDALSVPSRADCEEAVRAVRSALPAMVAVLEQHERAHGAITGDE